MPFTTGRVSFCRFRVEGHAPGGASEELLKVLAAHSFTEGGVGAPADVEAGWITGEHLFDTQFSYEKNIFGNMLYFALRVDTNRVPGELKHAYKRMNELSAAENNPSGFASKAQKREAGELAARQINEELAAGKHRRPKSIPVLWDVKDGIVYCGSTAGKAAELLAAQFRASFSADLTPLTAGALASVVLFGSGRNRDYDDLRPSPFTPAPAQTRSANAAEQHEIPPVPWAAASKDFLGNEFLLWLWWRQEAHEGLTPLLGSAVRGEAAVMIQRSLEMHCAWGDGGSETLRSDTPTRMAEAAEALLSGKWPRKAGLILADAADDETQWQFTLQGDLMQVSSASLPPPAEANHPREVTEHRLNETRRLGQYLDGLFARFLEERLASHWPDHRDKMRAWIRTRRKGRSAPAAAPPLSVPEPV